MRRLLFLLFIPIGAWAQTPVSTRPDCTLPLGTLSGPAPQNTTAFDNRVAGCTTWQIVYNSTGFSALSLVVQTAPNNGGVPGSWSTFTAVTGVNPNTSTTENVSTFGGITSYFPFLRVQLTSITGSGTISGQLFGWRTGSQPGGGTGGSACAGTAGTPCIVAGPDAAGAAPTKSPVLIAGIDFNTGHVTEPATGPSNAWTTIAPTDAVAIPDGDPNTTYQPQAMDTNGNVQNLRTPVRPYLFDGATWDKSFVCTNQVRVHLTDGTRTALVAPSGSTVVRVCQIHGTTDGAAETWTITQGTGAACVTGTTTIDSYLNLVGFSTDYQPTAALRTAASNGLCIAQSGGSQNADVVALYAQF